ncbi:helix-turn-helix domain-containing protein [Hymenobacter arizonensis]|uniref:Helix-turn-helix domain-containing protein n=1 Tax=Hymenobacter arizonensis TaxID=1227077 RepID=A0A1I5Z886_HYMAR|nr:helix-turn-helix domain-containing protein [Hymenobacter arizonensis]SFQ52654.1 Helix-turn-helix domain-containing protein [Hymenobacter arizonensis]
MPKQTPQPPSILLKAEVHSDTYPLVTEAFASFLAALDRRTRETISEQWSWLQANTNAEVSTLGKDEPITVEKTAELLDVAPQTVLVWRKRGLLIGYKLGNRVYFKRSEVLAALKVQSTPDGRRKYARRQYEQKAR